MLLLCLLVLAGGAAVYWLAVHLRGLIVMLIISLFLSFAMEPGVKFLAARGWKRGWATGLAFLILLVIMVGFGALMAPLLFSQIGEFVGHVPSYVHSIENLAKQFGAEVPRLDVNTITSTLQTYGADIASNIFGIGAAILGALFQTFTIFLFTFYLVAEGPKVRRLLCSMLKPERQREFLRGWDIAIEKTGGYLYSRLLLAAICAFFTWIALKIIGVPYAEALALWTGLVSQFIPAIGTYIAATLPILIALLVDPWKALFVLIFIVLYQQLENYFLSPRITSHTMQLHPAVAFGAAIAGGSIMGAVGALLGLPAAAIIQAFASTYIHRHDVIDSHLTQGPSDQEKLQTSTA